jgi:hypothetical protein
MYPGLLEGIYVLRWDSSYGRLVNPVGRHLEALKVL